LTDKRPAIVFFFGEREHGWEELPVNSSSSLRALRPLGLWQCRPSVAACTGVIQGHEEKGEDSMIGNDISVIAERISNKNVWSFVFHFGLDRAEKKKKRHGYVANDKYLPYSVNNLYGIEKAKPQSNCGALFLSNWPAEC